MSEDTKNKQCQICKGYLFKEDDIVVCPICGAPHHRDCYQTVGHCGLEEFHGTSNQYNLTQKDSQEEKAEARKCNYCGRTAKTDNASFCPYCGHPYLGDKMPHIVIGNMPFNIDPLGGVDKNDSIDGVPAKDVATFVGSNSIRYLPKFKKMNAKNKNSWNWSAFLFPSAWCLSRKMYQNGILFLLVAIASSLCFVPYEQTLARFIDENISSYTEIFSLISTHIGDFSIVSIIMCFIGIALSIIPRIICGLKGDYFYKNHCVSKIKKIKSDTDVDDLDEELKTAGGISILLMFAALLAQAYLPNLITMFIW
jgi:RNA polymerase subunit RPABC4/transcription elongation factor Spt4